MTTSKLVLYFGNWNREDSGWTPPNSQDLFRLFKYFSSENIPRPQILSSSRESRLFPEKASRNPTQLLHPNTPCTLGRLEHLLLRLTERKLPGSGGQQITAPRSGHCFQVRIHSTTLFLVFQATGAIFFVLAIFSLTVMQFNKRDK